LPRYLDCQRAATRREGWFHWFPPFGHGALDLYVNLLNLFDRQNYFPSPVGSEGGIPDIGFTASFGSRWTF
jgi:hypothetical protein